MIEKVILALGLVLVIEGLAYALAPSAVEAMLEALKRTPLENRRLIGLIVLALGVLLVWVSRLVA